MGSGKNGVSGIFSDTHEGGGVSEDRGGGLAAFLQSATVIDAPLHGK